MSKFVEQGFAGRSERPKRELPSGVDIFVPLGQEQGYLAAHGIEVRSLANGAMLAGATRRVEDAASASINVAFPSAPYHEPAEKRGVSHLMEHFIAYSPLYAAFASEAYYNATTSARAIRLELQGRAHPQVREYGVWPVLPIALDEVTQPLSISKEALRREKGIVVDEIHQRQHGLGASWEDNSLLVRTLYAEGNPNFHAPGGSASTVESLTGQDIEDYRRAAFIPQGLIASVFAEGSPEITRALLDQLEDKIGGIPDDGRRPTPIDDSLHALMNPNYQQGGLYVEDTLRPYETSGRQRLHYVWVSPIEAYTPQAFAESRFMEVANSRIFQNSRNAGIAYTVSPITDIIGEAGDARTVWGFTLDIMKQADPVAYAQQVYSDIGIRTFEGFDDADLARIDSITHYRSASAPITVNERFGNTLMGLEKYGRVIDTDKTGAIHNKITPEHLRRTQTMLLSTSPTIIVEGDLSK